MEHKKVGTYELILLRLILQLMALALRSGKNQPREPEHIRPDAEHISSEKRNISARRSGTYTAQRHGTYQPREADPAQRSGTYQPREVEHISPEKRNIY
jgi:hypothetical protein